MASLTVQLSETALMWARAVAPCAEWIAAQLWSANRKPSAEIAPATRLTQSHKRQAKRGVSVKRALRPARILHRCRGCGKAIRRGHAQCSECSIADSTRRLTEAAKTGRIAAHTPAARTKEGQKQREHAKARAVWMHTDQSGSITVEDYSAQVQPLLFKISTSKIARAIGVSRWYAGRIRQGYRPHPRHWAALARLAQIATATVDMGTPRLFQG